MAPPLAAATQAAPSSSHRQGEGASGTKAWLLGSDCRRDQRSADAADIPASEPTGNCAYVFLLYGRNCEEYFLGACCVAWSLLRHRSVFQRVLMHTPDVPQAILDTAGNSDLFCEIRKTEYIEASPVFFSNPQAHRRFSKIFTKYRVFELDHFDKVLFLDADLYLRDNLDCLFKLQAPAAMARGPDKPKHGERMKDRTPVNAGVMLLNPSKTDLDKMLHEVTGSTPRKLQNYNSPDADYLTEIALCGQWTSLDLAFNYQLEFEYLDVGKGSIRFSAAREEHFSDAGASMNWELLKVLHFSGDKPWKHITQISWELRGLEAKASKYQALADKLLAGFQEYSKELRDFQGLCSQLPLGEGVLWHEVAWQSKALQLEIEEARAELHAHLPQGGRWYEGQRPGAAVWIPPSEMLSDKENVTGRLTPVGTYLEIIGPDAWRPAIGDLVKAQVHGVQRECTVVKMTDDAATLRREIKLSANWSTVQDSESNCPYYHNLNTSQVQWEFPELPRNWQAATDPKTSTVYYHNLDTQDVQWDPPTHEEVQIPLEELKRILASDPDGRVGAEVVIWKRSFAADLKFLESMQEAVTRCSSL